jgi:hypothetical protein
MEFSFIINLLKSNAMKNSIVIIALLLLGIGANAITPVKDISYVKTRDTVYFGQNLKIGLFNSKIISSDGTYTKISNRDVIAYMHNSHLFEYLPVIGESNQILFYAMMEYLTSRSGLRLFRYNYFDGRDTKCYYYVFKDGKFYLKIDQRNALTVFPFFGINDIKLAES